MGRLRQSLIDWASGLEPDVSRQAGGPLWWLASGAIVTGLLAAAAFVPPLRDFFGLRFWPLFGLQLLALGFAFASSALQARIGFSPLVRGLVSLTNGFLFQLFASGAVVLSDPPGSFVLASLPLVAWWLHGLLMRPTLHAPFPLLAHAAGMLCAFSLRPEAVHASVLLLGLPVGAIGALAFGSLADSDARRRRDLARQHGAIEAQLLEAQAIERERVAEALTALGERRGEARELLAAALAQVERADAVASALQDTSLRSAGVGLARGLRRGLERLERAVADAGPQEDAPPPAAPLEAVDAARVACEVVAEAARRFPGVAIAGPPPSSRRAPLALVAGGAENLRLMLEHLVANSCEGDGAAAARAVEVGVFADLGYVDLVVSDDGPGLRADLLAAPVRPFVTTKPDGSGLGLYTAARLAAASGGELLLENPAGGGARLTLRLPAAEPAP